MSAHTPGPWEAFTEEEFSGWWAIRQISDDGLNHEVGSSDGGFDEPDARLMAASPELLEALQGMVSAWNMVCDANGWERDHISAQVDAVKAINKATGSAA